LFFLLSKFLLGNQLKQTLNIPKPTLNNLNQPLKNLKPNPKTNPQKP
jgi:hypothetical protein